MNGLPEFPAEAGNPKGPCFEYAILMYNWIIQQQKNNKLKDVKVKIRYYIIFRAGHTLASYGIVGALGAEAVKLLLSKANIHAVVEVTTTGADGKPVITLFDEGKPGITYLSQGGENGVIPPGTLEGLGGLYEQLNKK